MHRIKTYIILFSMKKYTLLYILSLMVSLFGLPSCSEEDDTV